MNPMERKPSSPCRSGRSRSLASSAAATRQRSPADSPLGWHRARAVGSRLPPGQARLRRDTDCRPRRKHDPGCRRITVRPAGIPGRKQVEGAHDLQGQRVALTTRDDRQIDRVAGAQVVPARQTFGDQHAARLGSQRVHQHAQPLSREIRLQNADVAKSARSRPGRCLFEARRRALPRP